MKCGKTNICEVERVGEKYSVTWGKNFTGLDVYDQKVFILMEMILKDAKSWEVGILLTSGYVLWLSSTLISSLDTRTIVEYLIRAGGVKDQREILGAVFDNIDDVELFTDRLEKKYIVHLLKK